MASSATSSRNIVISAATRLDNLALALEEAIRTSHNNTAKYLINMGVDTARLVGKFPNLTTAAAAGNSELVKFLLEIGVDINATDSAGTTALYRACEHEQLAVVHQLIAAGADVHIGKMTPLSVCGEPDKGAYRSALVTAGATRGGARRTRTRKHKAARRNRTRSRRN